ncbi:MAG: hypothetical protein ACI9SE_003608 [Neolewinella sp.]|jgi:hypothetical protein
MNPHLLTVGANTDVCAASSKSTRFSRSESAAHGPSSRRRSPLPAPSPGWRRRGTLACRGGVCFTDVAVARAVRPAASAPLRTPARSALPCCLTSRRDQLRECERRRGRRSLRGRGGTGRSPEPRSCPCARDRGVACPCGCSGGPPLGRLPRSRFTRQSVEVLRAARFVRERGMPTLSRPCPFPDTPAITTTNAKSTKPTPSNVEQPVTKAAFAAPLIVVDATEHFAVDGLHQVRARLMLADDVAALGADECAQVADVTAEQSLFGS